jgi:hypothetical protein
MVQIHSPRPSPVEPILYRHANRRRPPDVGPGGLRFKSKRSDYAISRSLIDLHCDCVMFGTGGNCPTCPTLVYSERCYWSRRLRFMPRKMGKSSRDFGSQPNAGQFRRPWKSYDNALDHCPRLLSKYVGESASRSCQQSSASSLGLGGQLGRANRPRFS